MPLSLPSLSKTTADQLLNQSMITKLQHWSVLKASGATLREYLQGQITQDINTLSPTHAIHCCMLTPQGKAVTELYIMEGHADELIILAPASHAVATVARLRQFALGHDLRIGIVDALQVCSIQGANAAEVFDAIPCPEPDLAWLSCSRSADQDTVAIVMPETPRGYWIISASEHIDALCEQRDTLSSRELEAIRIIRGLPNFGVEWDESIHPLNANLMEFNGVSFDKGCYVGQEVTSRMHWRGGIKKKLYRVTVDGTPDQLPCAIRTTANIGELKSAAIDQANHCIGIALLPIDIAESEATLQLQNDAKITILEVCHA